MMNILNGGEHDNNVDVQESMILPVGAENCIAQEWVLWSIPLY